MTTTRGLLEHAQRRAESLRDRYRAAGFWSAAPVDLLREAARRYPDSTALVERGVALSYGHLDAAVDSSARAMAAAGVEPGEPVVVVAGNDVSSVITLHAAARVDAVTLLVARSSGAAAILDIAARSGALHGVAPGWASPESELGGPCRWLGAPSAATVETLEHGVAPPVRAADEPSLVLYTSGTTSRPKGVIHSHSTLIKAARNYIAAAGLGPSDRVLLISPMASVTGVLQAVYIAPLLGIPVVLEDAWSPAGTADLLLATDATWYGGPDRLLDRLLDEIGRRRGEVPLRAVYLGGTTLDRRIVERVEKDFGIVVMRAYGSSEVPVSTSGRRDEPAAVRHADDGAPLADVDVRVGSSVEPTECCITGPHTFLGYTDAADDAVAFDDGWFRTGDVAELVDGRVRIVGRLKDIVIRNGLKIPAAEVDEAVARVPGVSECAAFPVPDATTGEHLAVAVVLEPGVSLSLPDIVAALTAAGLPKYKLPEEIVYWDRPLPLNANGKVQRNMLKGLSVGLPRSLSARIVPLPG
ncbi:AMP-binding protein [Mycolicibacterium sp. 120266]|uniref:class I adenylate-forming enzyme family protein n=1 Tax=Mycolicibacterium sp. 120266 TaxID=3090601 RepID=UPI00299DD222|nr:AMP-binding protein [Mycolicibacterium sp. 120266]MDX1873852.1 AMP-binding protein [Mycolicibacterium sp. 120266]